MRLEYTSIRSDVRNAPNGSRCRCTGEGYGAAFVGVVEDLDVFAEVLGDDAGDGQVAAGEEDAEQAKGKPETAAGDQRGRGAV